MIQWWRWNWVEENVYVGGVEKDYRNFGILIAMNFRNTISLEIPLELLINSLECNCFLFDYFLKVHLNLFEAYFYKTLIAIY
jgi:hypothetical protein